MMTSRCVTLVRFGELDAQNLETALSRVAGSMQITVRRVESIAEVSYHPNVIHALVLSTESLSHLSRQDEDVVRSATGLGTCRVYHAAGLDAPRVPPWLDNFIQRTKAQDDAALADLIVTFLGAADRMNRHSTPLSIRDDLCIQLVEVLKFLWPVSCLFAALHALNAATVLTGRAPWLGSWAPLFLVPLSTFFGILFMVHSGVTLVCNTLFMTNIVRRFDLGFVFPALFFVLAVLATAFSIHATDHSALRISIAGCLAVYVFWLYLFSGRIRAECTSLSAIQADLADPRRQMKALEEIGQSRVTSSSFTLFPHQPSSLFISYMHGSQWSSENAALAHRWASESGLEVFLDRDGIDSGSLWRMSLMRAISECGYFVAILDGSSPATEWVLAESAYATMLRKSIGKPRILLVVRHLRRLVEGQPNPFHVLYGDALVTYAAKTYGTGVLPADNGIPSKEHFLAALQSVRPMSLIS